jgi:hypothetical protein
LNQISQVRDGWIETRLQADHRPDARSGSSSGQVFGLREIDSQWPLTEDHLSGRQGLRHEFVMIGHLHGDDDEVDAGVGDQLPRVVESVDRPLRGGAASGCGTAGGNGPKLILRQRL